MNDRERFLALMSYRPVDRGVFGVWTGGWPETYDAEYVALTQLQADAFVTLDADLARQVEGIVPTATIEALQTA